MDSIDKRIEKVMSSIKEENLPTGLIEAMLLKALIENNKRTE